LSEDWKSARLIVLEGTTISRGALRGEIKGSRVSNSKNQDYFLADRWFTYDQELDAELHSTTVSALVDEIKELMVEEASVKPMPPTPTEPQRLPLPEKRVIEKPKGRGLLSVDPTQLSEPKKPTEPANPLSDLDDLEQKSWLQNFGQASLSSLVWIIILLAVWNYLLPEHVSAHYKKLLLTLNFVTLPNEAYTEVLPYFTFPASEFHTSISEWVKSLELNSKWRGVFAGTITILALWVVKLCFLVLTAHKIEHRRKKVYEEKVKKISQKWGKIEKKYDEQLAAHRQKVKTRQEEIKKFEDEAQAHNAAIKTYEKDVTSAEHQYEIELQQREQIMKTRQEQYTSALANYDAQAAIVKSFRAELWDRARVCTRCGTPYLAPRVILG
jgi:hypothetical protein